MWKSVRGARAAVGDRASNHGRVFRQPRGPFPPPDENVVLATAPTQSCDSHIGDTSMADPVHKILAAALAGIPLRIVPYKEAKEWGRHDTAAGTKIGEYWYGVGIDGGKSSTLKFGSTEAFMADVLAACTPWLGGAQANRFSREIPLVKLLTPTEWLSVQFHDKKNEAWLVTAIDQSSLPPNTPASIILGYSQKEVGKHSAGVTQKYQDAAIAYDDHLKGLTDLLVAQAYRSDLEQEGRVIPVSQRISAVKPAHNALASCRNVVDGFYNYLPVDKGDVIAIEAGTLHALGPGVQVIEPQIAGDTQSTDDFDRLRYRDWWPRATKRLDLNRINETKPAVGAKGTMQVINKTGNYVIERFPGGFEKVGLGAHLITFNNKAKVSESAITSFHELWVVEGKASAVVGGIEYDIPEALPGSEMLFIPATAKEYEVHADQGTRIIDIFVP